MLRDWSGTDTWNSLDDGIQVNGVDAMVTPDAVTGTVGTGLLTIDVTASLKAWQANPATNYGWAIVPTGGNGVDFHSAEGTAPPRLVVKWDGPVGENVAQGKTATQSSTGWDGTADKAVDGNTDGVYSDGSVTHTQYNSHAWWQVDLDGLYQIDAIEIWNRMDVAQDRLSDFYVFVSDRPFTSNDPIATANQAGLWSQHVVIPGGPRPNTSLSVDAVGRYVRIQLANADYLSLAEVKVFGEAVSLGSNVAQGKTANQSSTGWGGSADKAVDGNTDGIYADGSVTHTQYNTNPWWQVDLGAFCQIDAIEVWNRMDVAQDRLADFYVFVSNTPFTSTDPAETASQPGVWSQHVVVPGGLRPNVLLEADTQGRYVRIQLADVSYLSLAEVKVFGEALSLGSNVAVGKTASQSSTGWDGSADRAVDGNTDGDYANGSVTHTQYDVNAWWQVDLGGSYQIDAIEIWDRTDAMPDRLDDFYIFISDTPFTSTDPVVTASQAGVWSQHVVGIPLPSMQVLAGTVGRYVRIQLADTDYLSLAEVKVFGEVV